MKKWNYFFMKLKFFLYEKEKKLPSPSTLFLLVVSSTQKKTKKKQ